MVKESAGAGDNNIGTFQFLDLGIDIHATVNGRASYARLASQGLDFPVNLFG
jgi:hypothetical protein